MPVAGEDGVKVTEFNASEGPSREQTGRGDWPQRDEKEPKPMAAVGFGAGLRGLVMSLTFIVKPLRLRQT